MFLLDTHVLIWALEGNESKLVTAHTPSPLRVKWA